MPRLTDATMTFRDRLLELKAAKGWSERELAEAAGLAWSTVHAWLQKGKSRRLPTVTALVAVAKALEVSIQVFTECEDFQTSD
jgi:transcriptional regulator with XRE-family HTH domain